MTPRRFVPTPPPAEGGFALVELLASLVLLGLLGALIVAAVPPGRRVWREAQARSGGLDTVVAAQSLLRERLSRLSPSARAGSETVTADVVGEPATLAFLGSSAKAYGPGERRRYQLRLAPGGDLVLDSRSELSDAQEPDRSEVILRGVQAIELGYYGAGPPDGAARWRPRWDGPPTAPAVVSVRVAFAAGDRRVWPELDVRPQATTDSACVIDPRDGRCRGRA